MVLKQTKKNPKNQHQILVQKSKYEKFKIVGLKDFLL